MRLNPLGKALKQVFFRDGGEVQSLFWHGFVNGVGASSALPSRVRTIVYRAFGIDVSWFALVRPGCIIRSRNLSIGQGSTINYSCVFDNRSGIKIGDRVGVGIGVKFLNTDHETSDPDCRAGTSKHASIVVGDGAFIGSNAVILPGVTIGDGTVIGASALVSDDCEPHALYVGVPARLVRYLPRDSILPASP